MARRVFRVLLILALAALAGVMGWQVWSLDRTRTQQRADAERLERDALRVTQAILDLRASQRAYIAPGQGFAAWKPRVDAHLAALRDQFQDLREQAASSSSPTAAAAAQADDEALDALVAARSLEQRIADHVTAGRMQHAADLVYADGVRVSLTLERAANAAFTAHAQDLRAGRTRVQWTEGALLGLAAAIGFVFALIVVPARRPQAGTDAETTDEAASALAGTGAAGRSGTTAGAAGAGAAVGVGKADKGGRRGEPAVQGLGLSSAGRSTAGGTGTVAGAATAAAAGASASGGGGASIPAAARAGSKGTGAGRVTPGAPLTGRGASSSPPAVPMADDDLPLHASAGQLPANAAQGRDRRDSFAGAGASDALAMGTSTGSSGTRQGMPQTAGTARVAAAASVPGAGAEAAASAGSASAGAPTAALNGQAVQAEGGMLAAAAELTVSVARVGDVDGLKPVMARLAEHLDAVGVIVWLEDAATQRLTPIVTHGYPAETLAHMPPIDLDADNATARAWRLEELQIVPSRDSQPGAIVVPMPSSAGCVGVVAAEVRHGREQDPATLALARILAAQLAMLTGGRG